MRIAFCTESFPPAISGVAVFVSRSAEELVKRGHQVIVLAPSTTGKPGKEQYKGVAVHRIRSIPSPFRKNLRMVMGQQLAVSAVLRRFKPDIIHIQDLGGASAAGLRWGRFHSVPVLGTRHFSAQLVAAYIPVVGKVFEEIGLIDSYSNEYIYNQCDLVTVPTETVKEALARTNLTAPVTVLSNGVDIPPLPDLSLRREGEPIVLTVSRIDEDKNLELLLEAAPLVRRKTLAKFKIVGTGNKLDEYRERVREEGMQEYVEFTGPLKPGSRELERAFATATLLAVPSLVETQSISTLEGMAMALPVVAVRAGALPEIVRPGETGYLVPVPNAQHFANTVVAALKDREQAEELGLGGRKLVEEEHGREKCVAAIENLYQNLGKG